MSLLDSRLARPGPPLKCIICRKKLLVPTGPPICSFLLLQMTSGCPGQSSTVISNVFYSVTPQTKPLKNPITCLQNISRIHHSWPTPGPCSDLSGCPAISTLLRPSRGQQRLTLLAPSPLTSRLSAPATLTSSPLNRPGLALAEDFCSMWPLPRDGRVGPPPSSVSAHHPCVREASAVGPALLILPALLHSPGTPPWCLGHCSLPASPLEKVHRTGKRRAWCVLLTHCSAAGTEKVLERFLE